MLVLLVPTVLAKSSAQGQVQQAQGLKLTVGININKQTKQSELKLNEECHADKPRRGSHLVSKKNQQKLPLDKDKLSPRGINLSEQDKQFQSASSFDSKIAHQSSSGNNQFTAYDKKDQFHDLRPDDITPKSAQILND